MVARRKIEPRQARTTRGARVPASRKAVAGTTPEELLRRTEHDLGVRLKELSCLYGISRFIEEPDASLQAILCGVWPS